ncbi:MAG: SHOCT domain-containing protein [Acidobacteria bacterium]|nr:SHOCT domain-containing protein [Acidobacteriota bacterium]
MSLVLHGGHGKSLFVSHNAIRIVHEHMAERHDTGIPIRNIAAVEVKKPGAFAGFIQFSMAGGTPHLNAQALTGGAFDAARDGHSVTFTGLDDYDIALKIKLYVESWPAGDGHGGADPGLARASAADEIRKLKVLLDEGVLTAAEFQAAKVRLLGE